MKIRIAVLLLCLTASLSYGGPSMWPAHDMSDPDFGDGPTPFPKPPEPPRPTPDGRAATVQDSLGIWATEMWITGEGSSVAYHFCPGRADSVIRARYADDPAMLEWALGEYARLTPLRGKLRTMYWDRIEKVTRTEDILPAVLSAPARAADLLGYHTVTLQSDDPPPGQLGVCDPLTTGCPECWVCWCETSVKDKNGNVTGCSGPRSNCDVAKKAIPCLRAVPEQKAVGY